MTDTGYRVWAGTHLRRLVFVVPVSILGAVGVFSDAPVGFRLLCAAIAVGFHGWFAYRTKERMDRLEYLQRNAVGRASKGSLVVAETDRAGLVDIVDEGMAAAYRDWPYTTVVDWPEWDFLFKRGLPGGPKTVVGHYVYSGVHVRQDDTIQVQCEDGDSHRLLVARVRWGCLQRIHAKSGFHGTEQEHRDRLAAMGIEAGV